MTGTVVMSERLRAGMRVRRVSSASQQYRTVEWAGKVPHHTRTSFNEWRVAVIFKDAPLKPERYHPAIEWEVAQ